MSSTSTSTSASAASTAASVSLSVSLSAAAAAPSAPRPVPPLAVEPLQHLVGEVARGVGGPKVSACFARSTARWTGPVTTQWTGRGRLLTHQGGCATECLAGPAATGLKPPADEAACTGRAQRDACLRQPCAGEPNKPATACEWCDDVPLLMVQSVDSVEHSKDAAGDSAEEAAAAMKAATGTGSVVFELTGLLAGAMDDYRVPMALSTGIAKALQVANAGRVKFGTVSSGSPTNKRVLHATVAVADMPERDIRDALRKVGGVGGDAALTKAIKEGGMGGAQHLKDLVNVRGLDPAKDKDAKPEGGGGVSVEVRARLQVPGKVWCAALDPRATTLRCPRRPGAVKHHWRFPIKIGFLWGFCMGAQGA